MQAEREYPGEPAKGSVMKELLDSTRALLESEINLAKAEIREGLHDLGNRLIRGVTGAVLLGMSLIPLSAFLVLGLNAILGGDSLILSSLLVTLVLASTGGFFAYRLSQAMKEEPISMDHTKDSLEKERQVINQNIEALRQASRRRKAG